MARGHSQAARPELREGVETRIEEWVFRSDYAERMLREQFGVATLDGFGLAGHPQAVSAAGAMVHYLRETSAKGRRKRESFRRGARDTWTASGITSRRTRWCSTP